MSQMAAWIRNPRKSWISRKNGFFSHVPSLKAPVILLIPAWAAGHIHSYLYAMCCVTKRKSFDPDQQNICSKIPKCRDKYVSTIHVYYKVSNV